MLALPITFFFFFFNDTATTEIYTLSLHDALPISRALALARRFAPEGARVEHQIAECPEADTLLREREQHHSREHHEDRKSTRLNSSHLVISYAVFCLKKKKKNTIQPEQKT